MDPRDQVVIITGAGSGVGRATAIELGRHGATVVCVGRRRERLAETVAEVERAGGTGLAVPADVVEQEQVEAMVATVLDAYGRIDVLFNNAGRFNVLGAVWEVDPDDWWQDATVNLRGTMLCCHAVLPHMIERDRGLVINMSGGNQIPGGTGYSCSKVAVIRFTELLAKELTHEGSNVVCCLMGPGFVRTEMTERQLTSEAGRKWLPSSQEAIDQGRDRPPTDCAQAVVRLLRAAGPKIHGGTFGPDATFD